VTLAVTASLAVSSAGSSAPVGDLAVTGNASFVTGTMTPGDPVRARSSSSRAAEERCRRDRPTLRGDVAGRRLATWRWQAELELARTRSDYRERVALGCDYLRWLKRRWALRADEHWRLFARLRDPETAIRYVFGRHAEEALVVAWCESRFRTWARNGQYLGLFQMGSSERARFGHGDTALAQARAAKRYFDVSGWSPWQCLPTGGLRW